MIGGLWSSWLAGFGVMMIMFLVKVFFMDFGLNYWYFCGFVACVLCWLSCIEWRCDDRISVVMLNKLENEPPEFMDFGLNYWYFCGFVACVLCWLSCIEWRCDDRISVVMLNKLENEPPEARRGAWRGLRANSGALLYKIMRSCMTLSNREHMAAYELLIYVATIWERLYRVVAYELPKGAV